MVHFVKSSSHGFRNLLPEEKGPGAGCLSQPCPLSWIVSQPPRLLAWAADERSQRQIETQDSQQIRIRGARVHNLRNIDLDIPRDRLVVITGPSGSGKSSLAFDTLYAEGQRQYIESLSVYARQFLHQLERPDVDLIEGLQPTVSIDQRAGSQNPRSTVATVTEIYDYLRLLYARLGEPSCYQCGARSASKRPSRSSTASWPCPRAPG